MAKTKRVKPSKVLILRYGAFGDLIYTLPLIEQLHADGIEMHLHTGFKGKEIFLNDSRFASITYCEPDLAHPEEAEAAIASDLERVQPDELINLSNTIETTLIPAKDDLLFDLPIPDRREKCGHLAFWQLPLRVAGYRSRLHKDIPLGAMGRMAFTEGEIAWAEKWRASFQGKFIVLLALNGSGPQKRFPMAEKLGRLILEGFPHTVLFLASTPETLKERGFVSRPGEEKRIYWMDKASFRQAALMARYADFVIGPETGLLVAAGMWGTPKTMLCTSSSVFQATHGHINDFSYQAQMDCSPCMRAIYTYMDCYMPVYGNGWTQCNFKFDIRKILLDIETVYWSLRYRPEADAQLRTPPFRVPGMRIDLVGRAAQDGAVQPGLPGGVPKAGRDGVG